MFNSLRNKLIFSVFFSLFSAGSFALYLANDELESIEELKPLPRSNQASVTFEELIPEDMIAVYEHVVEELIQKDSKYFEIAQYMVPRLLLWGAAGIAGKAYFGELNTTSIYPLTCTAIEGCYKFLKRLCKGKMSLPAEFHSKSKNHFFVINLTTMGIFCGAAIIVLPNEFGLLRELTALSEQVIRLFVRAEIKCEASAKKIRQKINQRLIDEEISWPLRLSQGDTVLEVNLEQVVGNKLFFKINDTKFQVKYDQNQCVICQKKWKQGKNVADILPCLHRFHRDCIKEWLVNQNDCPSCRKNVTAVLVSSPESMAQ